MYMYTYGTLTFGALPRTQSAVSRSRHVCCVTQQTYLLHHKAGLSAGSHSTHVCCVTRQTCQLRETADIPAVSHSRHVCCVKRQTLLLCHRTCMPSLTANMSAVADSIPLVDSAFTILVPLASRAHFSTTLIFLDILGLHCWEGGSACCGIKAVTVIGGDGGSERTL